MKYLFIILVTVLISCSIDQGPTEDDYIGKYEIYSPSTYLEDSLRTLLYYSEDDSVSTNYYNFNKAHLQGSFIEVYKDGTFYIRNSLLKDSIGTWKTYFDFEFGGCAILDFKNVKATANLHYGNNKFRILSIRDLVFKERPNKVLSYYNIRLIYRKVDRIR